MNRWIKKISNKQILILLLLLIVFFSVTVYSLKTNTKIIIKESETTVKNNINNVLDIKSIREKIKKENIVFLGDSITSFYPLNSIFNDMPVINSGVSGYKTTDILDRMEDMVYKYNPTKVLLLIGINDINDHRTEEDRETTVNNIKKIIDNIRTNRPKAKLYVESIYPINPDNDKNWSEEMDNEIIKKINKNIEEYCNSKKIVYIDIFDELMDDNGCFSKEYSDDGLHPNNVGYAKITSLLMPYILS